MDRLGNKTNFMDGLAGSFKPLMILIVVLIYFGKTIVDDYSKYHRNYQQMPISNSEKDVEEFELTAFKIKEDQLNRREEGAVELYEHLEDRKPKVTLLVDDIPTFLEEFHKKHKVIVKQFHGVSEASPKVQQEYIANYGVYDSNGELKTILIH